MGSGKHLRYSIDKYGIENFKKEILFQFNNETDMNNKESELVTEEFCLREDTYNICVGGQGGFSYINNNIVTDELKVRRAKAGRKKADENVIQKHGSLNYIREKWQEGGSSAAKEKYETDLNYKNKCLDNLEKSRKLAHTETATQKRKSTYENMQYQKGSNNTQFGTMWITNGQENKKIKKDDQIPVGWCAGRKIKTLTKNSC